MLKAICDICKKEGKVGNYLFPRNNEPTFTGYLDYTYTFPCSVDHDPHDPDECIGLTMRLEVTPHLTDLIGSSPDPETTICIDCVIQVLRAMAGAYTSPLFEGLS